MVTCRLINFIFLTIENKLWTDQWKGWQAKWLPRLGRMLPTQELPLLMETLRISSDPQHHMSSVFACSSLLHLFFCCNHQYQYSENIKWPLITSFSSPSSLLPWYGFTKDLTVLVPLLLDPWSFPPWSLILSFLILQFNSPSLKYSYTVKLRHHKYYQWVCFTLYFQAILFYIPRFLIIIWIGVINWAPVVLWPTGSRWIVLDVNFDKPRSKTLIYGCTKWRGSKTSIHVGRLMTF